MLEQAALDRVLLEMSRTLHTLVRALGDDAVAARDDANDGGRLLTVALVVILTGVVLIVGGGR